MDIVKRHAKIPRLKIWIQMKHPPPKGFVEKIVDLMIAIRDVALYIVTVLYPWFVCGVDVTSPVHVLRNGESH
ncbi:hypothetical protein OSB04_028101 [Centaurea solstitialis]|uniref:Uncharacterized protein n=1 Tax=Centaurea solstitialis TaxID=347529 RepID=A0AA38W7E5_9ASTR|nr:hypothetical protein OSB04_028101 [Centaurea solstitialis]